jgi:thiol-disulfide isomerase/thioredoxin
MRKAIAIAVSTILLALFAVLPVFAAGEAVPELTINMLSGKQILLKEVAEKNHTVILTFIQTACTTCKGEIVELQRLAKKNTAVIVIPVCVDMRGAKDFLTAYKADYEIAFDFGIDPDFKIPKTFGISFTPATVVIQGNKIAEVFRGYDGSVQKSLEGLFK